VVKENRIIREKYIAADKLQHAINFIYNNNGPAASLQESTLVE
jgi:hypothetical protein